MADNNTDLTVKLQAVDQLTPAVLKAVQVLESMDTKLTALGSASAKTTEHTAGLHGGLISLASGMEVANMAIEAMKGAWEVLEAPLEKAIEEALQAEKAQTLLTGALISTGQYSAEAAEKMDQYAEAVQKSTGANAEAVKTHTALGIQMGLTIEKSEEMEAASRKLALLMGGDQDRAFKALQQSLAGHSRGLALVLPQIKEFGTAQLQQGAAIDVVNKLLEAQYLQYQQSLPAALARSKSSFDDMFKSLGLAITASPMLKGAIDGVAKAFGDMSEWLKKNKEDITTWTNTGVTVAIGAMSLLNNTIDIFYRVGKAAFESVATAINGLISAQLKAIEMGLNAASHIPGAIGRAAKEGAESVHAALEVTWAATKQNAANVVTAVNQQTTASKTLDTALSGVAASAELAATTKNIDAAASERAAAAANKQALANQNVIQSYGEYEIGNEKIRKSLEGQEQERTKDFEKFKKYYDDKIALAVSKETEQDAQIANYKASKVKGIGGEASLGLQKDAEVHNEEIKQSELATLYEEDFLTKEQYANLTEAETEASYGRQQDIAVAHYEAESVLMTKRGDLWGAANAKIEAQQAKHGKVMGFLAGVQQTEEYKGIQTSLTNIASLRNSHSKKAFEIGKAAATVQATINAFLAASNAIKDLPFPINAIVAASELASGFVMVQNIQAQQFSAAHGGLDEVPQNLDNSTFLLKGGERVLQPEANKDLTGFLEQQKTPNAQTSGSKIMATVNLVVNGDSTASRDTIRKTAEALAAELRRMSERGDQIISVKGVY